MKVLLLQIHYYSFYLLNDVIGSTFSNILPILETSLDYHATSHNCGGTKQPLDSIPLEVTPRLLRIEINRLTHTDRYTY